MTLQPLKKSLRTWVLSVVGAAGAAAIGVAAATLQASVTAALIVLSVPGRVNATASIAAVDRFVVVVWGATAASTGTDVYAALSRDAGRTFGSPVRVNDKAGDANLNGEQPPHVVMAVRTGRDPVVTVVWTTKRASGTALLRSQSSDGGRSFTPAVVVPGTDAPGNRGWEAIAIDRTGRVVAAWLDHRELAGESNGVAMSHAEHAAHEGSGVETAQKSKLYFASLNGFVSPRAIAGGVCYCCKTAVAVGEGGAVYLAWRHVYPGNLRDIAFAASRDGGKTFSEPQRVSQDGWAITGCPENGPTMAIDPKGAIHIAWPTFVEGSQPALGLFYADSADGRLFSLRKRIQTTGTPSHAQMVLDRMGGLVLVWDELLTGKRQIMSSRRIAGAAEFDKAVPLTQAGDSAYPVVAGVPDAAVIAWTSGPSDASVIHVQRVVR